MSDITIHVLNLITGLPAQKVPVVLEFQTSPRTWQAIGQGRTNEDGRLAGLLPRAVRLQPGTYRLTFDVGAYFRSQNSPTFYPEVAITFAVRDATQPHHIPLLIGPFSYTTYRGS